PWSAAVSWRAPSATPAGSLRRASLLGLLRSDAAVGEDDRGEAHDGPRGDRSDGDERVHGHVPSSGQHVRPSVAAPPDSRRAAVTSRSWSPRTRRYSLTSSAIS